MKSWFYRNWSFGFASIAVLMGIYSTPLGPSLQVIYWLSILRERIFLFFVLFAWLTLFVVLTIWGIGKLIKRSIYLSRMAVVIMLASNFIATIILPMSSALRLFRYRGHVHSARFGFQVYHLDFETIESVQPAYSLYKCDGLGVFCYMVAVDIPAHVCSLRYEDELNEDELIIEQMTAANFYLLGACERTTLQVDASMGAINILEDGKAVYTYYP